jgi:hypothetical protein
MKPVSPKSFWPKTTNTYNKATTAVEKIHPEVDIKKE